MASSLVFLALFAIALCAPAKKVEFTVDSYFVGSWMISGGVLPANGGEIEERAEKYLFNVTKTADDIMAISYIDIPTNTVVEKMSMVASSVGKFTPRSSLGVPGILVTAMRNGTTPTIFWRNFK